ncbi:MAG: hypothetical protein C0405_08000 [Desulfovibrio sp.]|nr:hypothetical protein [Desulfovibrio sp.]
MPPQPGQGWAFFDESGTWRRTPQPWGAPEGHFPKELGPWLAVSKPKSWLPPRGTLAGESLLGAGGASLLMFAPEGDADASLDAGDDQGVHPPAGGHTKIGAGHKPQGYDEHGRYTGPGGGSVSLSDGTVRLHMAGAGEDEEPGEETGAAEPEAEAGQDAAEEVYQELEGVLVADSGRGVSDAGGEEAKAPATVTWKNDEPGKPDPQDRRPPFTDAKDRGGHEDRSAQTGVGQRE